MRYCWLAFRPWGGLFLFSWRYQQVVVEIFSSSRYSQMWGPLGSQAITPTVQHVYGASRGAVKRLGWSVFSMLMTPNCKPLSHLTLKFSTSASVYWNWRIDENKLTVAQLQQDLKWWQWIEKSIWRIWGRLHHSLWLKISFCRTTISYLDLQFRNDFRPLAALWHWY